MDNNNKIIGKRITAALSLKGKKQKELANYLQVKPNVISYFCNSDRIPNIEQLKKIAEYLSVSSDYLIGLSENPTIEPDIQTACKVTGLSEKAINTIIKLQSEGMGFGGNESDLFCSCKTALDLFITSDYAFSLLLGLSNLNVLSKQYVKKLIDQKPKDELSKCDIGTTLMFFENLEDFRRILKTIYHPLYMRAKEYYSKYCDVIDGYEDDIDIIKQSDIELQEIRKLYYEEVDANVQHNPTQE